MQSQSHVVADLGKPGTKSVGSTGLRLVLAAEVELEALARRRRRSALLCDTSAGRSRSPLHRSGSGCVPANELSPVVLGQCSRSGLPAGQVPRAPAAASARPRPLATREPETFLDGTAAAEARLAAAAHLHQAASRVVYPLLDGVDRARDDWLVHVDAEVLQLAVDGVS